MSSKTTVKRVNMFSEKNKNTQQYLTFQLINQEYGLSIFNVREVLELSSKIITKIYQMPNYFRGVINVRGSVVPIIDLRLKFGMEDEPVDSKKTRIIVIELLLNNDGDENTIILGILADSVHEVIELTPELIEKAPEIGNQLKTDYITGIVNRDERFLTILDINKILTTEELDLVNRETLSV